MVLGEGYGGAAVSTSVSSFSLYWLGSGRSTLTSNSFRVWPTFAPWWAPPSPDCRVSSGRTRTDGKQWCAMWRGIFCIAGIIDWGRLRKIQFMKELSCLINSQWRDSHKLSDSKRSHGKKPPEVAAVADTGLSGGKQPSTNTSLLYSRRFIRYLYLTYIQLHLNTNICTLYFSHLKNKLVVAVAWSGSLWTPTVWTTTVV